MTSYVFVKNPFTDLDMAVVPTGKTDGLKAEGIVITPNSGLDRIWFTKEDLSTPLEELLPF